MVVALEDHVQDLMTMMTDPKTQSRFFSTRDEYEADPNWLPPLVAVVGPRTDLTGAATAAAAGTLAEAEPEAKPGVEHGGGGGAGQSRGAEEAKEEQQEPEPEPMDAQ